jgi:hypothetical protein
MRTAPLNQTDRELVARLQGRLNDIRYRLGISARGEVLFRADLSYGDDEVLLVEADGFGGGLLRIVEGNYPVDYLIREEREFSSEAEAFEAAATLAREGAQ